VLPLLEPVEALALMDTCKALRELLASQLTVLGRVRVPRLSEALARFPQAHAASFSLTPARLLSSWPNVADLALHTLCEVDITGLDLAYESTLTALEMMSRAPKLTRLGLAFKPAPPSELVQWPPFICPTLRTLSIRGLALELPHAFTLLRALPTLITTSEARLEELTVECVYAMPSSLPPILATCADSLKVLGLEAGGASDALALAARGVEWASEAVPAIAACQHLVELRGALEMFSVLLPGRPTTTRFPSLATLRVRQARESSTKSGAALWKLMAEGRLPSLKELEVDMGVAGILGGIDDGGMGLAWALENVAGSLHRLHLRCSGHSAIPWTDGAFMALGVAIAKLPLLESLRVASHRGVRDASLILRGTAVKGVRGLGQRAWPLPWPLTWPGFRCLHVESVGDSQEDPSWPTAVAALAEALPPGVRVLTVDYRGKERVLPVTLCQLLRVGYGHYVRLGGLWRGTLPVLRPRPGDLDAGGLDDIPIGIGGVLPASGVRSGLGR
jgi:hypothetical protein